LGLLKNKSNAKTSFKSEHCAPPSNFPVITRNYGTGNQAFTFSKFESTTGIQDRHFNMKHTRVNDMKKMFIELKMLLRA